MTKTPSMRRYVPLSAHLLAPFIMAAMLTGQVSAQPAGWKPEKNVEIVVGLTAGSSQDRTGRALQKIWQDTNG